MSLKYGSLIALMGIPKDKSARGRLSVLAKRCIAAVPDSWRPVLRRLYTMLMRNGHVRSALVRFDSKDEWTYQCNEYSIG